MKLLLVVLLTAGLLPGGPELVVEGDGLECVATAVGDVEAFLVLYYDHDDPTGSGSFFTYATLPRWFTSGVTSVPYQIPVAMQWYGKPAGGSRFKLVGGCGRIPPKDITRPPRNVTPLTECPLDASGPMELYARAYYLHPDPDNPALRYSYKSETITTTEAGVVVLNIDYPVAVSWYYRQCGTLTTFPAGDWILAKTCGVLPAAVPVERFRDPEWPKQFALAKTGGEWGLP